MYSTISLTAWCSRLLKKYFHLQPYSRKSSLILYCGTQILALRWPEWGRVRVKPSIPRLVLSKTMEWGPIGPPCLVKVGPTSYIQSSQARWTCICNFCILKVTRRKCIIKQPLNLSEHAYTETQQTIWKFTWLISLGLKWHGSPIKRAKEPTNWDLRG